MKPKIFKERVSLYDHLVQTNPYIHGLYQVVKAQFTLFLVFLLCRDSYKAGRPWLDLTNDIAVFGGMSDWLWFLAVETVNLSLYILLYPVFLMWKSLRQKVGVVANLIYFLFLCFYVVVTFSMFYFTMDKMKNGPRLVTVVECSRFVLKTISFVRENAYKILYPWHKDDEQGPAVWYGGQMSPKVATFSQYMYFLVAPTLIYRDHYPRNKGGIKWGNVASYATQFLMVYLLARVMFMELQYPKSFKLDDLVDMYLLMVLVGPLMNILASILVLHAYFNLTAELTRFADREFYLNWWSAVGYTEYYKLWNIPVHDYTTFYIYGSLKPYIPRPLAGVAVLILSAFMHDFIIGVGMGFFLPVFLVMFALIGGVVFASGIRFSKYLTFLLTCVGYVMYQGVFYLELGARHYCKDSNFSYFSIHTPYCFQQHNNVTLLSWWE